MASIGDTTQTSSMSSNAPYASAYTAGSSFTARRIGIYLSGTSTTAQYGCAIYANGGDSAPETLIVGSSAYVYDGVAGVHYVDITNTALTNGTVYWLAVWCNTTTNISFGYHADAGTLYGHVGGSFITWPDPHTHGLSSASRGMSIIADDTEYYTTSTSSSTSTTSSSSTSTTSSSSSTSTSTSISTSTTISPVSGGLAFGEQYPTDGEIAIKWGTWDKSGSAEIIGDGDWGKLQLPTGESGWSRVYDFGDESSRYLTITENKYGTGQETATIQIRGQATIFTKEAETPAWENYSVPVSKTWRFIQVKAIK